MIINRMLVVDDDLSVCRSIAVDMQGKNTEICCAASAAEALERIIKTDYCLAIMSNQLRGISGIEMIRAIRRIQHIPIIVLAASISPNDKAALLRAGADAVMDKPVNMDLCTAQAETLIQLYTKSDIDHDDTKEGQLSFGKDLTIIPRFRQVLVDGDPLSLTRKEFDLLHYFACHSKRVFSREQLYTSVWGGSFTAGGDETVRVHIQNLRKKLETKGKHFIHNVWGVGYKFMPPADNENEQK